MSKVIYEDEEAVMYFDYQNASLALSFLSCNASCLHFFILRLTCSSDCTTMQTNAECMRHVIVMRYSTDFAPRRRFVRL
jgi:hypothetical protein